MPLQEDSAAVFRWPLKAFVYVFHQQVYAILVQRLNTFLNVAALKGAQHLQHQTLGTVLVTNWTYVPRCINNGMEDKMAERTNADLDVLVLGVDWWVLEDGL